MKKIVIKMGGIASKKLDKSFFKTLRKWQQEGNQVYIVHGGGQYITTMMEHFGLHKKVCEGLRVTDLKTLEITRMVLLGQVQPMLTSVFQKEGFHPVCLHAGFDRLIEGKMIDEKKFGFVGQVTHVNSQLLESFVQKNQLPIIAPLGITSNGQWLNINADETACQIAASLQADQLFLLTDVPGIKKDKDWLKEVSIQQIEQLKMEQVITGGMIPKLNSAKKAILSGVAQVNINNQIQSIGTKITA